MQNSIPFMDVKLAQQELRSEIGAAVARVMASGVYILGPELQEFEKEFGAFIATEHCVGVACGFDGFCLALRALDVGPGDEVIVPSNAFIALWFAVTSVGAKPVPVEPNESSYNIEAAAVDAALTPRTKAIFVSHMYGQPAEMSSIVAAARARKVKVVEDVSQAHGAWVQNRRAGAWGDASVFDFYPPVNLGAAGDGGAVLTSDAAVAEKLRSLRNLGAHGKYFSVRWGMNSRLGEFQAAVLRVKLHKLDEWNLVRQKQAELYHRMLVKTPGVSLPEVRPEVMAAWHRFVIRHPDRDRLSKALQVAGLQTMVHYPVPPHLSQAYAQAGYAEGAFPVAEKLAKEVLSLPIGPHLNTLQMNQAATLVHREASALLGGGAAAIQPTPVLPDPAADPSETMPW